MYRQPMTGVGRGRRPKRSQSVALLLLAFGLLTGCPDDPVRPPPQPNEPSVCFPGTSAPTCVPILKRSPPEAFTYPRSTDVRYAIPSVWLDLGRLGPDLPLSAHFTLGELTNKDRGQYASLQPFAVDQLQKVRNAVGSIRVTSGYRNPEHNRAVGGALLSRHQYGDGFDLVPLEASQDALQKACDAAGATFTMTYEDGHVHCDWRDGNRRSPDGLDLSTMVAGLTRADDGSLTVEAEGFDEGPPTMTWRALDAEGKEISKRESIKWRSRTHSLVDPSPRPPEHLSKATDSPAKTGIEKPKALSTKTPIPVRPPVLSRGMAFTPPANYAVVELMIGGRMVVVRHRGEIKAAPIPTPEAISNPPAERTPLIDPETAGESPTAPANPTPSVTP